jgi:hypothetical protein
MQRRIISMDLGVATAHVAVVCDETGRCSPEKKRVTTPALRP